MKYLEVGYWIRLWRRCPPVIKLGVFILIIACILSYFIPDNEKKEEAYYMPGVFDERAHEEGGEA